jgi:hypothetical protein
MCDSVCEIKPIDAGNIGFLFSPCRECTYWEEVQDNTTGGTSIKQRRFATTLQSFGSCGFLLFLNGQAGGYVQYGYPSHSRMQRNMPGGSFHPALTPFS